MAKVKARLMEARDVERTLTRLAHEIIERQTNLENVAIIGIHTRGEVLAQRILKIIADLSGQKLRFGTVDVTFYRDDFRTRLAAPRVKSSQIPFAIDDLDIILIDDVLYTGRTVRAALNSVMDFGRPASIHLAVLVDRGHRELPVRADYIGRNYPTSIDEHIHVHVEEVDGADEVLLMDYSA